MARNPDEDPITMIIEDMKEVGKDFGLI